MEKENKEMKEEKNTRDNKVVMEKAHMGYSFILESELLPFVAHRSDFKGLEDSNERLQKFVRFLEKKFDAIWYIGADVLGDEIYERFMFHHGGFMEISLKGKIRCYFKENKIEKLKLALVYATEKLSHRAGAIHLINNAKVGQRLISIKDSILFNIKETGNKDKEVKR